MWQRKDEYTGLRDSLVALHVHVDFERPLVGVASLLPLPRHRAQHPKSLLQLLRGHVRRQARDVNLGVAALGRRSRLGRLAAASRIAIGVTAPAAVTRVTTATSTAAAVTRFGAAVITLTTATVVPFATATTITATEVALAATFKHVSPSKAC